MRVCAFEKMDSEEGETERESSGEEEQGSDRDTAAEKIPRNLSNSKIIPEEKKKKKKKRKPAPVKKGKTGVCYISRIPPHLKPLKLRHLLSQFGEVSRVYLVPEDPSVRIRRKRAGGNSGKNFTEGWVEFFHKGDAKKIAAMLNGEAMDRRKRSAYHYDLWNIKYLKKFKWDNLTGDMAHKKAEREQKLAAELSAAKRERDFYLSRVDQARAINSMQERKRKKSEMAMEASSARQENVENNVPKKPRLLRHFSQRRPLADPTLKSKPGRDFDVLGAIFRNSSR